MSFYKVLNVFWYTMFKVYLSIFYIFFYVLLKEGGHRVNLFISASFNVSFGGRVYEALGN